MGKEAPQQVQTAYVVHESEEHTPTSTVYVKPGFKERADTFDEFSEELAECGHRVYTLTEPQHLSTEERLELTERAIANAREWYRTHRPTVDQEVLERLFLSIPPTIFDGAIQLIQVIENTSSENRPVQVLGHSRGVLETAVAAFLRPDLFPSAGKDQSLIVLLNPAGMTGKEGVQESVAVAASKRIRDGKMEEARATLGEHAKNGGRITSIMAKCLLSTVWSWIKAPNEAKKSMGQALVGALSMLLPLPGKLPRALSEAHDMANTDIFEFLKFINEVNGVRIALVYDEHDRLFDAKTIERRLEDNSYIESYKTENGTHFAPITKPDETAEIADDIIRKKQSTVG